MTENPYNNEKKQETILGRQQKEKERFLEQLRRMPIKQIAYEKSGIGKTTYYRWRSDDEEFRKAADEAIVDGEALITDMSETQLISLIKEKNFSAVQLWLRHHHPKYTNKIEVISQPAAPEKLNPEQEAVVKAALKLTLFDKSTKTHGKFLNKKSD